MPAENTTSVPTPKRRFRPSVVILVFAVPIFYLISVGPAVYLVTKRYHLHKRDAPADFGLRFFATIYKPAFRVGEAVPVYNDYLAWCEMQALEALQERLDTAPTK